MCAGLVKKAQLSSHICLENQPQHPAAIHHRALLRKTVAHRKESAIYFPDGLKQKLFTVTAIQRGASELLGHTETRRDQRHIYNPATEIRLQALAHSPTSDPTVTPGEGETL